MIQELKFIAPELVLAVGAMITLLFGVYASKLNSVVSLANRGGVFVLISALAALLVTPFIGKVVFNNLVIVDVFAVFIKGILIFSAAFVLILSTNFIEDKKNKIGFEYPILIILSVLGMIIMVSSNDFLTLYLGLELQSLSLYVLAAIKRDDKRASEAAIKYFVLGALASGLLLYGISLIYGFTGSTNFTAIQAILAGKAALSKPIIVGLVLVTVGLCFKISAAPFHMWTPDVYEGVPVQVTAYFAIVPKLAVMAAMIRIFADTFGKFGADWQQIIIVISLLSMLVGAFAGVVQQSLKRLFAYSSIANVGYSLVALAANTQTGVNAILAFFVIYILNSLVIFLVIFSFKIRVDGKEEQLDQISGLKGLAAQNPVVALLFSLMLFSLIGIPFPPYPGFFGKFFVFDAAINAHLYVLAIVGVLSSAVAAFYYLKIVKIMYFDKADEAQRVTVVMDKNAKFTLFLLTIMNLAIFLKPSAILSSVTSATNSLF